MIFFENALPKNDYFVVFRRQNEVLSMMQTMEENFSSSNYDSWWRNKNALYDIEFHQAHFHFQGLITDDSSYGVV